MGLLNLNLQPGLLSGGQQPVMPRVPWGQNPMITMAGIGLLSGRNLNEGFANLAQTVPAGLAAKSGMQQFMVAQQEREQQKAEAAARAAQMNDVIKNFPNIPEHLRPYYMANPDQFGSYVTSTMTPDKPMVVGNDSQIYDPATKTFTAPPGGGEPDPTDDLREYEYARSQGFTGTFQDWQIAMKRAGASNVSVDNVGTIPQGYELFTEPKTGAKQMRPIPGGPADTTKKDDARTEQTIRQGDVVLEDIRRAKEKVANQTWYAPVTGVGGQVAANVGGSAAADTAQLINTISSSVAFDRLQAMREASPTGGALGAVTERELALLQSTLGSLSQSQSKDQLLFNLNRLEEIYQGIMRKAAAYPNASQFGFASSTPGAPNAGVYEWSPDNGLRPAQ